MPGAYSTFDTLSMELGEMGPPGLVAPTKPLPVLARIPLIERRRDPSEVHHQLEGAHATSGPKNPQLLPVAVNFVIQTDSPETDNPESDSPGIGGAPQQAEPVSAQHESAPTSSVAPFGVEPPPVIATPVPQATNESSAPEPATWVDTFLRIEAAIAPYSQIIVLITLLAAASLTLVLLRGEEKPLESGSPKSTTSSSSGSLASDLVVESKEESLDKIELGSIAFDSSTDVADNDDADNDDPKNNLPKSPREKAATTAMGPVSIAPAKGVTPEIRPIGTHRVASAAPNDSDSIAKPEDQQVRVALAPPPYPSTSTAPSGGFGDGAPSDRPQARLQGHITPYRQ